MVPTGSLHYRKNEADILAGKPPKKYRRIVPYVPGERILEIGSAEGVMALMLARQKQSVIALEINKARHEAALRLQRHWRDIGINAERCAFINGDVRDWTRLFAEIDTIVAIRAIYHWREAIFPIFAEAALAGVRYIVLGGNAGREERFKAQGAKMDETLGQWNYYATYAGMCELLEDNGYKIVAETRQFDPLVVGWRG